MSNPYCDKDMVKDRMLIVLSDTSYNDALDVAIEEASRLVDVFLKPYTTVPLTDIVYEDATQTNTQSESPVELKLSDEITVAKTYIVQYLLGGNNVTTSYGQIYINGAPVGTLNEVVTNFQPFSEEIICSAGDIIQIFGYVSGSSGQWCIVKNFKVTEVSLNDQIAAITADFAASMFKRRMLPDDVKIRGALQPDMINEIDSSGWFAQGVRKIEQYIKSYYTLAQTVGNTAHNPDIYLNLFKSGIITGKEARAFINTASAIALTKIDTITRTETIIRTEDVTKTEYNTKKQKSFSFIKSDGNDGYEDDTVLPD
jgi:hypothetical protein